MPSIDERQENGGPARPPRLAPGGRLGRYELLEELGRGGMGVVFKASDPSIGRLVAIKTLRLDLLSSGEDLTGVGLRFAREARVIGQLSHPNIVTLYDAQQEGDVAYLVMEFVPGESLDSLLNSRTTFSLDRVRAVGMQVCEALEHAHALGIVHRDIKPANILWQKSGQVKVTDFGVAHLARSTLTETGQRVGTPSYMSPEQIQGKPVDGRSDLFSLGAVLYELACNERAFPGDTISTIIYRILHTDPIPLHRINKVYPPELDAILTKALAKDPAARYARAIEFRDALARQAAGKAAPVRPAAAAPPAPRRHADETRRRPTGMLIGGGVVVAALALALWVWYPRPSMAPPGTPGDPRATATAPGPAEPAAHPSPLHVPQPAAAPASREVAKAPAAPAAPPPAMVSAPAAQAPGAPPSPQAAPAHPQGARPLRMVFARDVRGVLPVDERDTFYRDEPKVILWVRWTNVRGKHQMVVRWFDPGENLVHTSSPESFESPADWWTTWSALNLRQVGAQRPGQWRAEVQLDGQSVATANFTLLDQLRPPEAKSPPAAAR